MAYCGPRGIPLSEFLGWEQGDQDAALTWQGYESRRCPGCGSHPDEPQRHYHVDVCATCVQLEKVRDSEDAKTKGAHITSQPGTKGTCLRCRAELEANLVRG